MGSLGLNIFVLTLHVSLAMDRIRSLLYTLKNLPSLYYLPFYPSHQWADTNGANSYSTNEKVFHNLKKKA